MGGISGLIYSSPVVVFVPMSSLFAGAGDHRGAQLRRSSWCGGWSAGVRPTGDLRLHRCRGLRADRLRVGESKGYFLLGIWSSLFWATVFAVSVLIRRPVVGYIWGWVNGHDRGGAGCAGRCWPSTSRPSPGFWCSIAVRRAAASLRRRPDRLAGRRPHRDGVAADRGGGAGDLSGHPSRPARPACAARRPGYRRQPDTEDAVQESS